MQTEQTSQPQVRRDDRQDAAPSFPTVDRMGTLARKAVSSRLFLMTTLGAATGQVSMLAAEGLLASPGVVVTVALTVVAGVGAFVTALDEVSFAQAHDRRVFTATAVLSILANVAAAGLGVAFAQVATIEHIRYFGALALGVVAVEIASKRSLTLPHGVPLPGALVAVGILVEILL
jgi:hypothetical protein